MTAVGLRSEWWSSLFHRKGEARGDVVGGLTAAVVLLAVEGSYGLIAFSNLGHDLAQFGFMLAVFTAAISSVVTLLAGSRGPMLSGSSAALALLIPSITGALMLDPRFLVDGRPNMPLLVAFAAFGVVLAGVLQVLIAAMKMGGLVRYVPYPVHAGYMNGTAVLMFIGMLPHVLGMPAGQSPDMQSIRPLAPLVAAVAFLIAAHPPRFTQRIPAYLLAIAAATALHHVLALTPTASLLGPQFEPPKFSWPSISVLQPVTDSVTDGLLAARLWTLLQFAAAVAFVSSLQTALAGSTVDELTHQRNDRGREMLAQGAANIAIGIVGGIPAAGAVGRTKVNLNAGARSGVSRLFFGFGLIAALVIGLRYMTIVPMAAIAGVFIAVAYTLIDAWTRRATSLMWAQTLKWRVPRALGQSYLIMVVVALTAIVVSLPVAIGIGMLIAILMFIKSNSKKPVRQVVHADVRRSRKIRPADENEVLRANGQRIALIELDGALFFGTAEAADEEMERLVHIADFIVIDFQRVTEVDASGARVLLQAADLVQRSGKKLLLAGLAPRNARTRMIRDMDVHERFSDSQFFPDADRALEHAEDRLLEKLARSPTERRALMLEETLLGSRLDAAELAVLAGALTERRFRKGEMVFRSGDPGDAMYVLMQGQIGIWLAGQDENDPHGHRLVSYAPGVVFGEMALLADMARSAQAIVESDAVVLELRREQYDALSQEHPALFGKLLHGISLLLATRVRALTDELQATQAAR